MSEENKDTNVEETEEKDVNTDDNTDNKDESSSEKLLTQAEVNETIAKRLARERSKYADYDELKTKLSEYEKAEEERKQAEMTEVERLQAQLEKKETAEQELSEQLEAIRNQAKQERINNEFIKQATANNVAYVDAAIKLADLSSVDVDDDGNINGVDEVIAKLVEDNPFLLKKESKPKHIGGGTASQKDSGDKTKEQLIAEAEEKARKTGRVEDRVAVARLKRELM